MKLFTVGPVEPYPCTRQVYEKEIPYFRTAEYSALVQRCMTRLGKYLGLEEDGRLIYYAASGTGAMEAAIDNLLSPTEDKALVINGGTFGARFCQLLTQHRIPHTEVKLTTGEALGPEHLAPHADGGYTALLVNLHETSTGQLYDLDMLGRFCRENNLLFIVDAISTFMVDPYNMQQHGVDATIFSSQKGLCLSAGMSFVALSRKALHHQRRTAVFHSLRRKIMRVKAQAADAEEHGIFRFFAAVGAEALDLHFHISTRFQNAGRFDEQFLQ